MANADVPDGMAKVQCITDLRPWAAVDGGKPRPLAIEEVVNVPRDGALDRMKRSRHVVEIA